MSSSATRMVLAACTLALGALRPHPLSAQAPDSPAPAEAVAADDAGFGLELSVEAVSRYVWRSYDLNHGDPSLLTYLTWSPESAGGLYFGAGTIAGLAEDEALGDTETDVDEIDLTIGWEHDLVADAPGMLTFTAELLYYGYVSTWSEEIAYEDDKDVEVSAGLSWAASDHFAPFLTYYRGLDDFIEGNYFEVGAAFPFELSEAWSLEPAFTAGWSDQYEEDPRFTSYVLELPLGYSAESWSASFSASWAHIDDPESSNPEELVGEAPKDDLFWAGLELVWTF